MKPISVGSRARARTRDQPANGAGRSCFKPLLLASVLLSGGLAVQPANAAPTNMVITTAGTITSGSETGGLFGLPSATTSLVGDSYTLAVDYSSLGPNYFSVPGAFASDVENSPGTTGYVTLTLNGQSVTTPLTNSLGSSLFEDGFGLNASNVGYDGSPASGAYVSVSQFLSCTSTCVPNPDLLARFSYILGSFDIGTDLYTLQGAGFPAASAPVVSFDGTPTSFDLSVPEPASWVVLATGLLGLGTLGRRRRA